MEERDYLVGLSSIRGLGPVSIERLMMYYGTAQEAWRKVTRKQIPREFPVRYDLVDSKGRIIDDDSLAIWQEEREKHQVQVITKLDILYPERLKTIYQAPWCLFFKGNQNAFEYTSKSVALVGARKCSPYGRNVAHLFARQLSQAGVMVVSGGALGIDGASHQGALEGHTPTIAIMGCGLDVDYPKQHYRLFRQIVDAGGLLVSEYPLGVEPKAMHFPMRNRLISGITRGTIVIEAKSSSGSLITADMAINEGRDVYSVPGNVLSDVCAGNHWLIRQGAMVLTNVRDLLEDYDWVPEKEIPVHTMNLSPEEASIIAVMATDEEMSLQDIAEKVSLSTPQIHMALVQLEMKGQITHGLAGYVINV